MLQFDYLWLYFAKILIEIANVRFITKYILARAEPNFRYYCF